MSHFIEKTSNNMGHSDILQYELSMIKQIPKRCRQIGEIGAVLQPDLHVLYKTNIYYIKFAATSRISERKGKPLWN